MVAHTFKLIAALLLTLCLSSAAHADEAQEALVEQGVAAYDDGDYQRAKDILLPLAEAGHPKAMNMIGLMHYDTPVFPNDPNIECDWYEKAANAGYPSAMYNLSICFHEGSGRLKDDKIDHMWLLMAANNGYVDAIINMAANDKSRGSEYRQWMLKGVEKGSNFAKVSLWLRGYTDDVPSVTARDIICVSWHIILLDRSLRYCD